MMKKIKKKKAFLGAAIGAATSVVGGILNGSARRRAARRQRAEEVKRAGYEQAAAMTNSLNNDYADEYNDKIVLRNGGKIHVLNSNDRLKYYRYRTRKTHTNK